MNLNKTIMCSYRNIQFVPLQDEGYRRYRSYIAARRKTRTKVQEQPQEEDHIQKASRIMERMIRNMKGGSEENRVIRYEFVCGGMVQKSYLECDMLRHQNDSLVITEIKATDSYIAFWGGCKQLKRIHDILSMSDNYMEIPVIPRLIIADYQNLDHEVGVQNYHGLDVEVEYLPVAEILAFADNHGESYDPELVSKAQTAVFERAARLTERTQEPAQEYLEPEPVETCHSSPSDFAMLLNQAFKSIQLS